MLYLTKVKRLNNGAVIYSLFETHTDSLIKGEEALVKKLITGHRMEAKNFYTEGGKIKIKSWPHKINSYSEDTGDNEQNYILLGKANVREFALISRSGRRIHIEEKDLKQYIRMKEVVNCIYTIEDKTYKSIDTYEMKKDPKFEAFIAQRYAEFIAKSAMLGLQLRFDYAIENEEVKLQRYKGRSKKVILPSFITTICDGAFLFNRINDITLNTGLKYIGKNAFMGSTLIHTAIPSTVEFIGENAFDQGWITNKEKQKNLNPNIVIIR